MISAQDAADTLRLLVPGFLALKVFYVFGLKTRRTDLEWTLWSLLMAAVIDGVVTALVSAFPTLGSSPRLLVAIAVAIVAGAASSYAWLALVQIRPTLGQRASRMAWDAVLRRPQWVRVHTKDGRAFLGNVRVFADPVEVDDLDVYVTDVTALDAEGNEHEMPDVEGVLIARDNVALIEVIPPLEEKPTVTEAGNS